MRFERIRFRTFLQKYLTSSFRSCKGNSFQRIAALYAKLILESLSFTLCTFKYNSLRALRLEDGLRIVLAYPGMNSLVRNLRANTYILNSYCSEIDKMLKYSYLL